jgi:hypothetical protein
MKNKIAKMTVGKFTEYTYKELKIKKMLKMSLPVYKKKFKASIKEMYEGFKAEAAKE